MAGAYGTDGWESNPPHAVLETVSPPWDIRPYMDRNPTCEVGTPSRIEGVMLFHQFRVLMCGRGFVTPHSAGSVQRAFFPSEVAT